MPIGEYTARGGVHAADHVVVLELIEELVALFRKGDLLDEDIVLVEPDEQGLGLERKLERLLALIDPDLADLGLSAFRSRVAGRLEEAGDPPRPARRSG